MELQAQFDERVFMAAVRDMLGEPYGDTVELTRFPAFLPGADPTPDFVDSVRDLGVLEPVLCYEEDGELHLLGGHRRVKAARLAKLRAIRALVYPPTAKRVWATLSITLNERRTANPVLEFEAIRALQGDGLTIGQIATVTGTSTGTVKRRMKLANLHPELYEAARGGKITPGVLEAAAKLPMPDQDLLAGRWAETKRLKHDDVRELRQVERGEQLEALPDELFAEPKVDPLRRVRELLDKAVAAAAGIAEEDIGDFVRINLENVVVAIDREVTSVRHRRWVRQQEATRVAISSDPPGSGFPKSEWVGADGVAAAGAAEVGVKRPQRRAARLPKQATDFALGARVAVTRGRNAGAIGMVAEIDLSRDSPILVRFPNGALWFGPNSLKWPPE